MATVAHPECHMRPRSDRLAGLALRGVILLGFFCEGAWAQGAMSVFNEERNAVSQGNNDAFILGRQIEVSKYSPAEAIQWGLDFVISPAAAKDRVVLYGYDIHQANRDFFSKLENIIFDKEPLIAIISSSLYPKENDGANRTSHDFAVPIILDPRRKSFVSDFILSLADPNKSARLVPAVIAVSALKSQGIGWDGVSLPRAFLEPPWSALIASSIPIGDETKAIPYIGSRSGWSISKNPPASMATQAELQRLLGRLNL